jgi:hypothetical protein
VSYETLKEIIKLQNLVDERIMFAPEQFHQLKNEITELKNEITKVTHALTFGITILTSIQILLILYLLQIR